MGQAALEAQARRCLQLGCTHDELVAAISTGSTAVAHLLQRHEDAAERARRQEMAAEAIDRGDHRIPQVELDHAAAGLAYHAELQTRWLMR